MTGLRYGNSHTWLGRSSTLRTRPPKQSSVVSSTTVPGWHGEQRLAAAEGVPELVGLRVERNDLEIAHRPSSAFSSGSRPMTRRMTRSDQADGQPDESEPLGGDLRVDDHGRAGSRSR